MQELIFTNDVASAINSCRDKYKPVNSFVVVDENTLGLVWEGLSEHVEDINVIVIPCGDENKGIKSVEHIWQVMSDSQATRHSMVFNVGGGMVTDLGGFAAATFKRGVKFVNIPTTLLGAVDAAVGGKTGINFNGFKNEVGVFAPAESVIISSRFFSTLPQSELLSGYAEILKHALLQSLSEVGAVLSFDFENVDYDRLLDVLKRSVLVKQRIVEVDPTEKGLRKALNLGHTAGHGFESFAMRSGHPIPHGYAVAYGLVTELILSHMLCGFSSDLLHQVVAFVRENYGAPSFGCNDYDALIDIMKHDKKNVDSESVNFTLLSAPGEPVLDMTPSLDDIRSALDITRDFLQ